MMTVLYSGHLLACEKMVIDSGLEWLIMRLAVVPILALQKSHPILFEIGLHNRTEVVHPADSALAIANALRCEEVWGKVLLIGGGPACQLYFREYNTKLLTAFGIGPLPEEAFSKKEYYTDWLDTTESQGLLNYQRHSFDDIIEELNQVLGFRRNLIALMRPLARRSLLRLSPYWRGKGRQATY
jgi:hypothetical protein